ncbi:MAG: hypothetical protein OEY89_09035 [Gammaproteobacteria bacterium]|nr:hypothetical protein [Gammaproteobacteria bacterium]
MSIKSKLLIISTLILSTSVNAALISRLGGLAYYDDVNDITWLADANYAQTSGYDVDGQMTWDQAMTWVSGLNVGGVTGWRLPDTIDVGNDGATYTNIYQGVDSGYNITTHSELSNMFYNVLGNLAYFDTSGVGPQAGWGLANTGPFSNLQLNYYWSATEYAPDTGQAWLFVMDGIQSNLSKTANISAWAVYSGDVSAVPVPAAVWLFGSGLLGLIGVARGRKV